MPTTSGISAVDPAEFDRVTEVWEAAVRATHHFLSEAQIEYFRPLVRHTFLDMVTLSAARDARGEIVGFAGVSGERIEMLFVHPAWHGRGIGRMLLQHALAQGARAVDVNEENEQALRFYQRCGFSVMGRSELDSLGKPFPLLHMRHPGMVAGVE